MAKIEIEIEEVNHDNFPNKTDSNKKWYIASQRALLFKDGEKYPHQFKINLGFSGNEADVINIRPINKGVYNFSEEAFFIDNKQQCQLDASKLKAVK